MLVLLIIMIITLLDFYSIWRMKKTNPRYRFVTCPGINFTQYLFRNGQ
jgi:hypothetical protein